MPFTRADWNGIIQQVNDVIQNPPPDTDCEPLPPLDEVGLDHIWSKADVQGVQDALIATCPDISFSELNLWEQRIVDEINDALGQAWCNCEDDDDDEPVCDDEIIEGEDGVEFLLYDNGPPKVVSSCLGTDTPPIPLAPFINGVQFGVPDILSRSWRVVRRNHQNNGVVTESSPIASGNLSCQGVVTYSGSAQLTTAAGIGVVCVDCESSGCQTAIADAQAIVLTHPTVFYSTYHLIIESGAAFCRSTGDPCP